MAAPDDPRRKESIRDGPRALRADSNASQEKIQSKVSAAASSNSSNKGGIKGGNGWR